MKTYISLCKSKYIAEIKTNKIMKSKYFSWLGKIGLAGLAVFLISADHLDAPSVSGTSSDITDFYAFQSADTQNFVLIANVQGLLYPGNPTKQAEFDENVLIEFKIDTNNDLVEDYVIQAIRRKDSMYFFGPTAPPSTGLEGQISTSTPRAVKVSTTEEIFVGQENGIKLFAGPREDPTFFDVLQFENVMSGTAIDGFNNPGTDAYAGLNVLSVVIEFPKSMLPSGTVGVNPFEPTTPIYNVWVTTKRKL